MGKIARFFNKAVHFCRHGVWIVRRDDTSPLKFFLCKILKVLILTAQAFTTNRLMAQASALTYSTLLAIVPIVAVVFAIARGFGVSKNIETWFRESLASQPQVAETIIGFVNSYLVHAKGGVILGFGLLIMVWTVVMLTNNIETTFNSIWHTKSSRSPVRMLFDYIAFIFLIPIFIVVTSGVSIFLATTSKELGEYVAPVVSTVITLMPYVIMSVAFICLYVFMPNTRVRLKNAVAPGILAGVSMQVLQFVYIHSQIWVSSYNAIYGSFAALPLFMLWLQISWTIILVGALLCYTNQNHEDLAFLMHTVKISHRHRLMLSVLILSIICKRFKEGKKPLSSMQLKDRLDLPNRIVTDLLRDMQQAGLLEMVQAEQDREDPAFLPACDVNRISLGWVVDRLESLGPWRMDTPVEKFFSQHWKKAIQLRNDYLKNLDSILLHDL